VSRRPCEVWFKTRHTEPFVVPVRIFKANANYVYPDNPVGSQSIRRKRIGTETSFFPTEDEAWAHVNSRRGRDEREHRADLPS
jgi:hypothetical protein